MTNYKKEDEESAGVRNETRLRFLHEGSLIKKWHRGEMVRGDALLYVGNADRDSLYCESGKLEI